MKDVIRFTKLEVNCTVIALAKLHEHFLKHGELPVVLKCVGSTNHLLTPSKIMAMLSAGQRTVQCYTPHSPEDTTVKVVEQFAKKGSNQAPMTKVVNGVKRGMFDGAPTNFTVWGF
jgi:hypothetical protein